MTNIIYIKKEGNQDLELVVMSNYLREDGRWRLKSDFDRGKVGPDSGGQGGMRKIGSGCVERRLGSNNERWFAWRLRYTTVSDLAEVK